MEAVLPFGILFWLYLFLSLGPNIKRIADALEKLADREEESE